MTIPDLITPEQRFTGAPQASRALGISTSRIYELLDAGEIRSVRFGGRRLIPVSEVDRIEQELLRQLD